MRYFLVLIFISLLVSCRSGEPSGHLSPKVMTEILLDINVAEAYSVLVKDNLHRRVGKNEDSLGEFYKDIFAHYNISATQFSESLRWYKIHPEEMDSAYAKCLVTLGKWQTKMNYKARVVYPDVKIPYYEAPRLQEMPGSSMLFPGSFILNDTLH